MTTAKRSTSCIPSSVTQELSGHQADTGGLIHAATVKVGVRQAGGRSTSRLG